MTRRASASSRTRARTTTGTRSGRSPRSARRRCRCGTSETRAARASTPSSLPGGFSYGDYLRCGAIARFSPATDACTRSRGRRPRARHLQRLPDPLRGAACCPARCSATSRCASSAATCGFASSGTTCRSRRAATRGQRLVIPVKHGDGRWFAPPGPSRARGARPVVLATGDEPERLGRRRRRRLQRGGQRHRA